MLRGLLQFRGSGHDRFDDQVAVDPLTLKPLQISPGFFLGVVPAQRYGHSVGGLAPQAPQFRRGGPLGCHTTPNFLPRDLLTPASVTVRRPGPRLTAAAGPSATSTLCTVRTAQHPDINIGRAQSYSTAAPISRAVRELATSAGGRRVAGRHHHRRRHRHRRRLLHAAALR
jgi:hypothetical protein